MALTTEEVKKVALLSRLELSESEVEKLGRHLNDLLSQFEKLQLADVTDVDPLAGVVASSNVFRDDISGEPFPREEMLFNAPEARDGCVVVPRIIEG